MAKTERKRPTHFVTGSGQKSLDPRVTRRVPFEEGESAGRAVGPDLQPPSFVAAALGGVQPPTGAASKPPEAEPREGPPFGEDIEISQVSRGVHELEYERARTEQLMDELSTNLPSRPSEFEIDRAVVAIARRNGRVLLALLDVWTTAVGDHVADAQGGDIYNALKCAADVLLHMNYLKR